MPTAAQAENQSGRMKYEMGAKKHIAPSFDERFKRGSNSGSDTQQISSLFRQIGNHLGVADRQCKLKLVFQPGFLQHVRHMVFDR